MMFDKNTHRQALAEVRAFEEYHGLRVVFACVRGSQAAGYAGRKSDLDLFLVYVRPVRCYYGLTNHADALEACPANSEDTDVMAWDVRKASRLVVKGNAQLLDMLRNRTWHLDLSQGVQGLAYLSWAGRDEAMRAWTEQALRFWSVREEVYASLGQAQATLHRAAQVAGDPERHDKQVLVAARLYLRAVCAVDLRLTPPSDLAELYPLVYDREARSALARMVEARQEGQPTAVADRQRVVMWLERSLNKEAATSAVKNRCPVVPGQGDREAMEYAMVTLVEAAQT